MNDQQKKDEDNKEITNIERANDAEKTLQYYSALKHGIGELYDTGEAVAADLLADLMHYCRAHQYDFLALATVAEKYHIEELVRENPSLDIFKKLGAAK